MVNILLFGVGSGINKVIEAINFSTVNILAFVDNHPKKVGRIFNEKKIISIKDIKEYEYDYIIISSSFFYDIISQLEELGIKNDKIYPFYQYYICNYFSDNFEYKLYKFLNSNIEYETIITGISYHLYGIDEKIIKNKAFNFALGSQDLYFDFNIVKYLFCNYPEKGKNIKNVIIGLSYYSFEYDLSKSHLAERIFRYYSVFQDFHNLKDKSKYSKFKYLSENVFISNFETVNAEYSIHDFESSFKNDINTAKEHAFTDSNKNYPKTVIENIDILLKYLEFLKQKNINPILVICPVTKIYSNYFSKELVERFYESINYIREKYNVQFLDHFYSDLFNDEDFCDFVHLSKHGSEKFTSILNNNINWRVD
jgi:DltD C-terminal region.